MGIKNGWPKIHQLKPIDIENKSDRDGQKQEIITSDWVSGKFNSMRSCSSGNNIKTCSIICKLSEE